MSAATFSMQAIAQALSSSVGERLEGRELDVRPGMTWSDVARQIEPGQFVVVPVDAMPHPRDAGAIEGTGLPRGQSSDWRFPPAADCTGVHVQRFGELWEVHRDRVHPKCSGVDHLRHDAPGAWIGGGLLVGSLVGALKGRTATGALVGGVAALLTLPKGKK